VALSRSGAPDTLVRGKCPSDRVVRPTASDLQIQTAMTTRRAVAALALAGCLLTFWAVDVEARAGSGGVRGARTSSSPARPKAPEPPARHAESLRPGRDASPDASRLMGGAGSFVAGGLILRMLAGHGFSGAGVGLPDLLVLGIVGLAGYGLLRALARSSGPAGSATRRAPPRATLRGALDRAAFAATAQQSFVAIERAVALGDVTLVCDRLVPATLAMLQDRCRGVLPGERRVVEPPEVEVVDVWRDHEHEHVQARFIGPEERWTFRRPIGATRWKVVALDGFTG